MSEFADHSILNCTGSGSRPRILLGCNFSNVLPDAFASRGWDVLSCDLVPGEHDHPHYVGSVTDLFGENFDLAVFMPPCTHLSVACANIWPSKLFEQYWAFRFFMRCFNAPFPRVCVENPVGYPNTAFRAPDMIFHPYEFGDPYYKRTCFWLRNLPPLICPRSIEPRQKWLNKFRHGRPSSRHRSRFFPAVADAMAEQWSPEYLGVY